MLMSNLFFYTLRETAEDDSISNQLLTRTGMIRRNSAGVYSFMPLGYKVLKNIEKIIREEMDKEGANELLMPALLTEETYEKAGRLETFGNSILKLKDRNDKKYVLGPTHEEVFTETVRDNVKSYKQLPINLYQFQTKYRDEARPRYGLLRTKEFIMKDAYSFDTDFEGLDVSYDKMFRAYKRMFDRMKINYAIVKADTGAMGGLLSEEFMALAQIGEDKLVICNNCDFSANLEVAKCKEEVISNSEELKEIQEIYTPNVGKIEDVTREYGFDTKTMTKSLIFKVDEEFVLVMIRSDREVNIVKVQKLLNAKVVELATEEDVMRITNAKVGFAGAVGLKIKVVADNEIKYMKNFLVGANKTDYHYINVNLDRDIKADLLGDIRNITEQDVCPKCGGKINFVNGIEVGNTFKLGTKYSEALGCLYVDEQNKQKPMVMGCYGIGPARCLATIVEQHHDENGIIWPASIAPYQVVIIPVNLKDDNQYNLSKEIYQELMKIGLDVVLDDRDERPGVKFKDADLIGFPIRITVGKKAVESIVEYKERDKERIEEVEVNEIVNKVLSKINKD